jgi:hypothetical protein
MSQLKFYNTNTSQWEPVIVGAAGPTGPTGATGPTGPTGATGAAGTNGATIVVSTTLPTAGDGTNGDLWIVYS